jgi:hypothetical protein
VLEVASRLALGGVLAGAALAKAASPRSSSAALASFGLPDGRTRWVAWVCLVAAELVLAGGVIAGADVAAVLAAGLMAMFALTMVAAILRGRAGAPCACFGARSTIGWGAVARNALLAGGFAALPFLPEGDLSTDEWLALGLAVALIACALLGVAVFALAREVGMLRLRLGPAAALEVPDEGPPLGEPVELGGRIAAGPEATLGLAVFVSESCRVCRELEPAIRALTAEPLVAVATFDEGADAATWERLGIPGSPYAIALDRDGTVLAKGTFNNLAQLESVLAAAERRRAGGLAEVAPGT